MIVSVTDFRPGEAATGQVLDDRFKVTKLLGAGAFGAVYEATQLVFGHPLRQVALKLFKAERVVPEKVHETFADAITLVSLQEENSNTDIASRLVQIYDMGVLHVGNATQPFISMRLVQGGNFQHTVTRFRQGGMPVTAALRYLRDILIPLAWMHSLELPVVHADLKPDNVLVSEDSKLVLTDFGLASRLPVNSLGGAIQYQAPETLAGKGAELGADVYAVGIMWYEMITGRHPFERVGLEEQVQGDDAGFRRAHLASRGWPMEAARPGYDSPRIVPASELNEEFARHPQLEEVLRRCLAYLPSERYPNAVALLADLESYCNTGNTSNLAAPRTDAPMPIEGAPSVADAKARLSLGDAAAALALLDRILEREPQHLDARICRVKILLALKRIAEATALGIELFKAYPKRRDVVESYADALEADGKRGLASKMRLVAAKLPYGESNG